MGNKKGTFEARAGIAYAQEMGQEMGFTLSIEIFYNLLSSLILMPSLCAIHPHSRSSETIPIPTLVASGDIIIIIKAGGAPKAPGRIPTTSPPKNVANRRAAF